MQSLDYIFLPAVDLSALVLSFALYTVQDEDLIDRMPFRLADLLVMQIGQLQNFDAISVLHCNVRGQSWGHRALAGSHLIAEWAELSKDRRHLAPSQSPVEQQPESKRFSDKHVSYKHI